MGKRNNKHEADFDEKMLMRDLDAVSMLPLDLPFTKMDYALDLNAIADFINYADTHETKELIITDAEAKNVPLSYDGENAGELDEMRKDMKTKEIREARGHANQQMDSLRYDLVKFLLEHVVNPPQSMSEDEFDSMHALFGYVTAMNTLLRHKFMVKYEDSDYSEDNINEYYN